MSAAEPPETREFDLSAVAQLENRKLPSVKWFGYGAIAFFGLWAAGTAALLVLGPRKSELCYKWIVCDPVPLNDFYIVYGPLLAIIVVALVATIRIVQRPSYPPKLSMRLSSAGLDFGRTPGKAAHWDWPIGRTSLIVYDWRTLSPGGRKYSPAPGSVKNGEVGDSFPLDTDALDGILAYARHLDLSITSSQEVLAGISSNLGTYTKFVVAPSVTA